MLVTLQELWLDGLEKLKVKLQDDAGFSVLAMNFDCGSEEFRKSLQNDGCPRHHFVVGKFLFFLC